MRSKCRVVMKEFSLIILFIGILAFLNFILYQPLLEMIKNEGINVFAVYNGNYAFSKMLYFTLYQAAMPLMVIFSAWFCLKIFENNNLEKIGLHKEARAKKEFFLGFIIAIAIMSFILLVEISFDWIDIIGFSWNYRDPSAIIASLYVYIIHALSVSVMEEVFIRGYLFNKLERAFGSGFSLIMTSCIFGLLHLMNPTGRGWALFVIPVSLSLVGLLFGISYLYKRSLWIPIGLHFAWNLFQYNIFGLTNIRKEESVFLVTKLTGPESWVGLANSSFGPEVGLLGFLGMLLGFTIFLFLYIKTKKISLSDDLL